MRSIWRLVTEIAVLSIEMHSGSGAMLTSRYCSLCRSLEIYATSKAPGEHGEHAAHSSSMAGVFTCQYTHPNHACLLAHWRRFVVTRAGAVPQVGGPAAAAAAAAAAGQGLPPMPAGMRPVMPPLPNGGALVSVMSS